MSVHLSHLEGSSCDCETTRFTQTGNKYTVGVERFLTVQVAYMYKQR